MPRGHRTRPVDASWAQWSHIAPAAAVGRHARPGLCRASGRLQGARMPGASGTQPVRTASADEGSLCSSCPPGNESDRTSGASRTHVAHVFERTHVRFVARGSDNVSTHVEHMFEHVKMFGYCRRHGDVRGWALNSSSEPAEQSPRTDQQFFDPDRQPVIGHCRFRRQEGLDR